MQVAVRFLIIAFVCATSLLAQTSTQPTIPDGPPYRAVAIHVRRPDRIDRYERCIDEIAALGADTVSISVDTYMESLTASEVWLDLRFTPTPDQLGRLIDHAHAKGLRVILMPIVVIGDGRIAGKEDDAWSGVGVPGSLGLIDQSGQRQWCGIIEPTDPDHWWQSYRDAVLHFAWIARATRVEIFCVGASLISTEHHAAPWHEIISAIRKEFPGQLTYSADWDHYSHISFWSDLDLIGLNMFWQLGTYRDTPLDKIQDRWSNIRSELLGFSRKAGKPLLFTQVGYRSIPSAISAPWDGSPTADDPDSTLQLRLYRAFFQTWHGNPSLGGFAIWLWTPDGGGPQDKGYPPQGKPAERELQAWLARPRWQLRP